MKKKSPGLMAFSRFLLSVTVLFLWSAMHAQMTWSPPVALTNTASHNTQPCLKFFWLQNKLILLWEKAVDSSSTAIFMKNLPGPDPEIEVLSAENVHYRNPRIFPVQAGSPDNLLFLLFFETGEPGQHNIHYLKCFTDLTFSGATDFFPTSGDDTGFDCNESGQAVWTSNGDLWFAYFITGTNGFSDPVLVDQGGCSNPKTVTGQIYWTKQDGMVKVVQKATIVYPNTVSAPVVVFNTGTVENLAKDGFLYYGEIMAWSAMTGSAWKIFVQSMEGIMSLDYESNQPFQPAGSSYWEGCVPSIDYFLAFPYEENGFEEIFINFEPNDLTFSNLSNASTQNRRPAFFTGEEANGCYYLYIIWESQQNGNWQLFHSKRMYCIGSTGEHEADHFHISISPNPFTTSLQITFTLKETTPVSIEVINLFGQRVGKIDEKLFLEGTHILEWKSQCELDPGVYMIRMNTSERVIIKKVVRRN
jgi:hypothetical protein